MSCTFCPGCEKADQLFTPRRSETIKGKRTTRATTVIYCERCKGYFPVDKPVKFWTVNGYMESIRNIEL